MSYILFHVPHSSLKIPNIYWKVCIKDKAYINRTSIFICDFLIDRLLPNQCHSILFRYSRLFCDVEKFKNDKKESMSKKGMGVIYTNDCDNVISIPSKEYKRKIIKNYYDKYHNKFDKKVTDILNKYDRCIIIDFHSFSDEMVGKLFGIKSTADICIGTDEYYTDKNLLDFTIDYFQKCGYSVNINTPYSGTMIPNKYFNKRDKRLSSIMLEINKRTYLNDNECFNRLKKCIEEYYNMVQLITK